MSKSSPRLQVTFDTHTIPAGGRIPAEIELRNIIAVLPGKSQRRIYVSGHYDSLTLGERGQAGFNAGQGTEGAARRVGLPGVQRVRRARQGHQGRRRRGAAAASGRIRT